MTNQPTVSLDGVQYVGFWIRVLASIIDSLLVVAVIMPLLLYFYGAMYLQSPNLIQGPLDFLLSWIFPAVAIIWFWQARQATPGKMLFSARIVDARTGAPPTLGQSIGRYLAYYVSIVPFCLGLLWVAFDKRKQGWHDKLAGTVVVKVPRDQ